VASNLSKNERQVNDCLDLGEEEILEYILREKLTLPEAKSLFNKVGIEVKDLPMSVLSEPLKSRLAPKITPSSKKAHAGIFRHYISLLESNPHFGPEAVTSIEQSIHATRLRMNLRTPLNRNNAYGLVLGRIQSGKTAHLIGTVLHALDSDQTAKPYDTVIILSGLIDDLRIQTRDRLEKVLSSFTGGEVEILPDRSTDLNSSNQEGNESLKHHLKSSQHASRILVVKKNHKILENILQILKKKPHYKRKKFLIIDDEADHASMDNNAENYENDGDIIDENPSLTNELLRKIMLLLSDSEKCWYIGYTATPYANLIMNASNEYSVGDFGLPLFPRDFLHALPKPDGHLDNEFYFSTPIGHNHVVIKQPPELDTDEEDKLVDDLFHRHLLTQILKRIKEIDIHHTTLVHTDIGVLEHNRYVQCFTKLLKNIRGDKNSKLVVQKLSTLLKDYKLSSELNQKATDELSILKTNWSRLMVELRKIKIVEVNRRPQSIEEDNSQDLEYSSGSIKRSYIAIGGTRLSRGLTLEGLTTTWFSRAAQIPVYDTMLQMARWCGYRTDYAELVKIFTTSEIRDYYQHITMVEKEVRRQIEILPPDADPMNTLIWIKEHSDMSVTAKMPSSFDRKSWGEVSIPHFWSFDTPYFGTHPELSASGLFQNFKAFVGKIGGGDKITQSPLNGNGSFKLRMQVKNDKVKKFLTDYMNSYKAGTKSKSFVRLCQILSTWDDSFDWNVGIHTPSKNNVPRQIEVRKLAIGLVQRTTDADNSERFSIIQTGNEDVDIDLLPGSSRDTPLLLLYLINPDAIKGPSGVKRVFHSSLKTPAIGLGIALPKVLIGDGGEMIARLKGA